MDSDEPILSLRNKKDYLCLICERNIVSEKSSKLTENGWDSFLQQAKEWSEIDIPTSDGKYIYTKVFDTVKNSIRNGVVHSQCRINFRTKRDVYRKRFGNRDIVLPDIPDTTNKQTESATSSVLLRKSIDSAISNSKVCFICNIRRKTDENPLNEGGVRRCTDERAAKRIKERIPLYLIDVGHRFYEAAKRIELMLSTVYDIFAADVFYHQSCYIKFAINPSCNPDIERNEQVLISDNIFNEFLLKVEREIIYHKSAFLLNDILKDLINTFEERGVTPPFTSTKHLKRKLVEKFDEIIGFFPSGRNVIVYSSDVDPCQYSVATLDGFGLSDIEIIKRFSKLIQKKAKKLKEVTSIFPESISDMESLLNKKPMRELYNTIYATIHNSLTLNCDGYAITKSHQLATKIWSLASDWEALLSKTVSGKQVLTGMVVHRMTGKKDAIAMLHKMNNCLPYSDIRLYNQLLSKHVTYLSKAPPMLMKGIATHATLDNNDGREETTTGKGTTHHTNFTMFQPLLQGEIYHPRQEVNDEISQTIINEVNDPIETNDSSIPEYNIGVKKSPPLFQGFITEESSELLSISLRKNVAWSIIEGFETSDSNEPLVGSWTCFHKNVSQHKYQKSIIEYLPMVPEPPEYAVCKKFLDDLNEMMEELEVKHMFAHADEMVYSKLAQIIWKHPDLYKNTIILMGGFHQLRVYQKIIFKRHKCIGLKKWFIDSGVIAQGSADQVIDGRHYYRCMRILKESFSALVQFKVEKITDDYKTLDSSLKSSLRKLKKDETFENLENMINLEAYSELITQIFDDTKGTMSAMIVSYLKDISGLLSLIEAVREGNYELHMQAESKMISLCFAFDHIHYSRYLSYQHVYLRNLEQNNHAAITDLKERGLGGTFSSSPFSTIHGDLITEVFNGQTKRQAGPHKSGFSTNTTAVNNWIRTAHLHAKLRSSFEEKLKLSTSVVHKETTRGARKIHRQNVQFLKDKLNAYNHNHFNEGPAFDITSGREIDEKIITSLIDADKIGNDKHLDFTRERLIEGKKSFFDPIKMTRLQLGVRNAKIVKKEVQVLKEDRQSFGKLLSNNIDLNEAMKFPITALPLSISAPDGSLRQGDKHLLRNFLIDNAGSLQINAIPNARWIIDSMAIIRTLKPQKTYRAFIKHFINIILPPADLVAIDIEIMNDIYKASSVKSSTRLKRGESQNRTHVSGLDQNMPDGKDWKDFFDNIENKNDLLKVLASYIIKNDDQVNDILPIVINDEFMTWKITKFEKKFLYECNHEEADTRIVLHALKSDTNIVVVSKDTDVLVLLVYAYAKFQPSHEWLQKIDHNKYVRIRSIVEYLGKDVAIYLPHLHAITGSDTTSYFYGIGKIKVTKKIMADKLSLNLLKNLGESSYLSDDDIEDAIKFVKLICYGGKASESLVECRTRVYKRLKSKSSQSIPPDPDSLRHHILRVHHQLYYWTNLEKNAIDQIDPRYYGWTSNQNQDEEYDTILTPKWYAGPQLPPRSTKQERKKRKAAEEYEKAEESWEEIITQDEVDLNQAIFWESSEGENQSDSDGSDW